MKMSNLIIGLQTLQMYFKDANGHHTAAEHDIFYVYATEKPVRDEDLQRLHQLGWFQPDADCGDADEWLPEHYDQEESWAAYT